MNSADGNAAGIPELLLRHASEHVPASELRAFAAECCGRVAPLCASPTTNDVLEFARKRSTSSWSWDELNSLRTRTVQDYEVLYPGHGAPSPAALAFCAAGEVAFTEDSLLAAINALEFVAKALAGAAAEQAIDCEYDAIHQATYDTERLMQANQIARRFPAR